MLELNQRDHGVLDRFLDTVLERYKNGQIELSDARADISEAFTLAANDNSKVLYYMSLIRTLYEGDS